MLYPSRWLGALVLVGLVACVPSLEPRAQVDGGSFGNVVATLMCKRIAYQESLAAAERGDSATVDVAGAQYADACELGLAAPAGAPPALAAFLAQRATVVAAVDAMAPADQLALIQALLTSDGFLATYDDGTSDAAVDALVETMQLLADDPAFAPALARLAHRGGYMPVDASLGLIAEVTRYPRLVALLQHTATHLAGDGQLVGARRQLEAALGATWRDSAPVDDANDPSRTLALALDLLLAEDDALGTGGPILLVRRDARGLARVAIGAGAAPGDFADTDGDGRADADAEGWFVDADGRRIDAPTPFVAAESALPQPWPYRAEDGRALADADGAAIYDYVDLDRTVLGAVVRDSLELVHPDRGVALELTAGAVQLSGPRVAATRTLSDGSTLTFDGHAGADAPLLDLVHAYLAVLADPRIDDALALTATLMREHAPVVARLAGAAIGAARLADEYPDAELAPGTGLYDDLMPIVGQILQTPGLAEDLLRAFEHAEVAELGLRFADHMSHRDFVGLDATTQALTVAAFSQPVDRGAPDAASNRSVMQRLLHLIHDSNGTVLCNKEGAVVRDPLLGLPLQTYGECEMLRIPNLALFYVQSIAYAKDAGGNVIFDDIDGVPTPRPKAQFPFTFDNPVIEAMADDETLEEDTTIEGFRHHPTPQALNRAMFLDPLPAFLADTMEPARCNQGDRYIDAHGGTLMAWELDGFYDQIRPIAQAFADHDAEQLLVDLMSVLHEHWSSSDTAVVRYEPLLVELLRRRDLIDATVAAAPVLADLEVGGRPAAAAMADAARAIFLPRDGLAARDGGTATMTNDGRAVDRMSAWHLIADANLAKRAALAANPAVAADWQRAVSRVIDVLLSTERVDGTWRFVNPRTAAVTAAVVDFARGRIAAHDAAGDRAGWLAADLPGRVESIVTGPLYAAATDLLVGIGRTPALRAEVDGLMAFLLDEAADPAVFATVVTGIADLIQLALDDADLVPILHVVGEIIRPERGIVDAQLALTRAIAAVDVGGVFATLTTHAFADYRPGHTAIGDIVETIRQVHRVRPYEDLGQPFSADDYRATFRGVAGFLADEKRGLAKLTAIIRSRTL